MTSVVSQSPACIRSRKLSLDAVGPDMTSLCIISLDTGSARRMSGQTGSGALMASSVPHHVDHTSRTLRSVSQVNSRPGPFGFCE